MGELCEKLAALGLDVEPSNATTEGAPVDRQNAVPRSNFNLSTGTVRHRWMPQFRTNPDSSLSSNVVKPITQEKTTVPQPPERCLTKATASLPAEEAAETRCKESRFFPLSAFLASPPAVARHSTSAKPSQPAPTHQDTKEKQLAITPSTVAQRAAARAACRALASGAASSAGPCVSLSTPISLGTHTSESAIPLQSSQISNPAPLLAMPEKYNHPSMDPPSTPLPITPPHTTTPTLTTSPAIPSHPYMAPSDSVISALPASQSPNTPPPLPLRPQVTSSTPQSWTAVSATGSSGPTSPLVLITAPVTSPHPFVTPPRPNPTVVAIPAMPKPFAPAVPIIPKKDVVPTIPKQQEIAPTSSVTQTELQDFLERGHADPCWCSRPSSTFCGPACATKVPSSQTQNKLTILRKRTFNEFELDTEIATMLGATSLSPTPQSTESEFEDLGYHGDSILTPASTDEEDDWDVVSAAEWFSRPRVCSIDTYQPTFEPEIVASPASILTFPSPPLTPILTPRSPSPPRPPTSPIVQSIAAKANDGAQEPKVFGNPWATSPPQPPAKEAKCADCSTCKCACTSANTSAVEWPTLQEAVNIKRTRREKTRTRSDASDGKAWEGGVDWFN